MKKYRAAVVGLGRMGSTIDEEVVGYPAIALPYSAAGACRASQRLELVAGADLDPAKQRAFAERWGVGAVYGDYREMIRQEVPDLVAICTRAENHAELALGVAEAGGVSMVFLEKAMACSMREADAILRAYQARNIAFNTGVLRRFDTRYHRARQRLAQGEIGELRTAVHHASSSLMHGHIHSVDTLLYLLGDLRALRVKGELRGELAAGPNRFDKDPQAVYQLQFPGRIEAWTVPTGHWDFEVWGTKGMLKGLNNGMDWVERLPLAAGRHTIYPEKPFENVPPYSATLYAFEDLVRAHEEGKPALGNVEITHHATEICLAVAQSHLEGGKWIDLPLQNRDLYVWHV
ncbi:MAG: Gfo/Idh/MocA family oxidoreductase [Candidatus Handelsmanbacteria bacterium]|nr:Gfo/Idh/MocA family oxidoreductase [Candidatus Handelsmanbacteria bacterium]